MYKIYADDTLIYDSTLEDFKIVKGVITLETNKSGSFVFALYPDHFYFDKFVRMKTIITVYKSGRIVFRGRILNDVTDHWNNKVLTCEGELGFLQDSIIRPYSYKGDAFGLFTDFITLHNNQVDETKRFKIGTQTLVNPNWTYIIGENENFDTTFNNLHSQLISDTIARYFQITHGEDGTDPIPTINHIADFNKVSTQIIEFGANLKNFTKTVKAESIVTAIIPLDKNKGTIASVNDGKDYIVNEDAVALYGLIFKAVTFEDAIGPTDLLNKGKEYLAGLATQNITLELTAIDLHLLDHSIESFNVGEYVRIVSKPHHFDSVLLCNKQTIDLLRPDNDTITLGYTYDTLTEASNKVSSTVPNIQTEIKKVDEKVENLNTTVLNQNTSNSDSFNSIYSALNYIKSLINDLQSNVTDNTTDIESLKSSVTSLDTKFSDFELRFTNMMSSYDYLIQGLHWQTTNLGQRMDELEQRFDDHISNYHD